MKQVQQDLFDRALAGLRLQGKPSVAPNGGCKYRSDDGCRCAIGWLIPDGKYDPAMEGNTALDFRVQEAVYDTHDRIDEFFFFLNTLQIELQTVSPITLIISQGY